MKIYTFVFLTLVMTNFVLSKFEAVIELKLETTDFLAILDETSMIGDDTFEPKYFFYPNDFSTQDKPSYVENSTWCIAYDNAGNFALLEVPGIPRELLKEGKRTDEAFLFSYREYDEWYRKNIDFFKNNDRLNCFTEINSSFQSLGTDDLNRSMVLIAKGPKDSTFSIFRLSSRGRKYEHLCKTGIDDEAMVKNLIERSEYLPDSEQLTLKVFLHPATAEMSIYQIHKSLTITTKLHGTEKILPNAPAFLINNENSHEFIYRLERHMIGSYDSIIIRSELFSLLSEEHLYIKNSFEFSKDKWEDEMRSIHIVPFEASEIHKNDKIVAHKMPKTNIIFKKCFLEIFDNLNKGPNDNASKYLFFSTKGNYFTLKNLSCNKRFWSKGHDTINYDDWRQFNNELIIFGIKCAIAQELFSLFNCELTIQIPFTKKAPLKIPREAFWMAEYINRYLKDYLLHKNWPEITMSTNFQFVKQKDNDKIQALLKITED